jgi:adenosyl cobinamide kinase/adenosyl cobinamide phosphate guanylyltransferase
MSRSLTVRNIYDKKHKTFAFDGVWHDVLGNMATRGIILIYGREKNGKTWFALQLANMLSQYERVLYISAEEGVEKEFAESMRRAGIETGNRSIGFDEYVPLDELDERLQKRKSQRVVVVDNLTIYNDEFKNGNFRKFVKTHEDKLLIFIAHEERGEPYTSSAKIASKLAKAIVRVQGLACFVGGRVPGGRLMIDERTARLYHGDTSEP